MPPGKDPAKIVRTAAQKALDKFPSWLSTISGLPKKGGSISFPTFDQLYKKYVESLGPEARYADEDGPQPKPKKVDTLTFSEFKKKIPAPVKKLLSKGASAAKVVSKNMPKGRGAVGHVLQIMEDDRKMMAKISKPKPKPKKVTGKSPALGGPNKSTSTRKSPMSGGPNKKKK